MPNIWPNLVKIGLVVFEKITSVSNERTNKPTGKQTNEVALSQYVPLGGDNKNVFKPIDVDYFSS